MQVQFWGAARDVPGSMHLLEIGGRRILLDCGLYQGHRKQAFERNRNFPFDPSSIDAVVLSHAHIDHCGNLPTRKRKRKGQRPFEPLYLIGDARKALARFRPAQYGRAFEPVPGVRATFIDAGHILGSASVILDLTEGSRSRRLLFSGDIGRKGLPILRDPQIARGADYVIMESTYGDREHEPPSRARQYLQECAESTFASGGKLLVPAFALGRTQEIVFRLNQMWEKGDLPSMDVFVDSPLAINVTEVYGKHPECYDQEMLDALASDSDGDPLGFRRLRYVRSAEESKTLNTRKGPAITKRSNTRLSQTSASSSRKMHT